ncbi:MAG: hypothetical protein SCK28_06430 [Bacillota bacterium]|nr:hypothetical protein [Bacillota bacterium]
MKRTGQPDNAERSFKCPNCGNMIAVVDRTMKCDVCGETLNINGTKVLGASNEGY